MRQEYWKLLNSNFNHRKVIILLYHLPKPLFKRFFCTWWYLPMCQITTSTNTHIVPAIQQFQLIIIIKRRWKCPQYELRSYLSRQTMLGLSFRLKPVGCGKDASSYNYSSFPNKFRGNWSAKTKQLVIKSLSELSLFIPHETNRSVIFIICQQQSYWNLNFKVFTPPPNLHWIDPPDRNLRNCQYCFLLLHWVFK